VGRVRERQLFEEAAARARAGGPSALIVHGEPGVGKTRLVTEIADHLGQHGFQVLWGRCVRFAAEASSYLPIVQALGSRLELTGQGSGGPVLHRVGDAVGDLMGSGPVALVVDDLQWADLSSLDVLTYLVAGFAPGQRLLVVGSYRDTELGTGHPLHIWLADLRRMPEVAFLRLGRLDRHDTEVLVDSVLGPGRHAVLAGQVFDRSDGNPYLVELLLRDLGAAAEELPAALPVDVAVLVQVAGAVGVPADKVRAGVVEATGAGLAVVGPDGLVWFHHPLVAEVLVSTLLPPDASLSTPSTSPCGWRPRRSPSVCGRRTWRCTMRRPGTPRRRLCGRCGRPRRRRGCAGTPRSPTTWSARVNCGRRLMMPPAPRPGSTSGCCCGSPGRRTGRATSSLRWRWVNEPTNWPPITRTR
jgi:AAA ATPase domain